jgi:hypothetical protein
MGSRPRAEAEGIVASELARLAEANGGALPRGAATRVYEALRAAGVGMRKKDALALVRDYGEYLELPGRVTRPSPERYATTRSRAGFDLKRGAALDVVARMRRDGLSLPQAVRAHNAERPDSPVSEHSVRRHAPGAIEKRNGRWKATPYDRYARSTDAITTRGVQRVTVRDSRTASLIARHWNAVDAFLAGRSGESALWPFKGKGFTVSKLFYALETDPERLMVLAEGGAFDDLVIGSGQGVS